jgi:SH3-like domain-containing protein
LRVTVIRIRPFYNRRVIRWVAVVLCLAIPAGAWSAERDLPRFASLKADKAYMRAGPGLRYPVQWVYTKRDMPVEIVAEFEAWRQVRDWKGTLGWMHTQVLSSRRSVIVTGDTTHPLRRDPSQDAAVIAKLEPGVIARLLECKPDWCRIEVSRFRGWLPRDQFWGVRDGEKVE